MYWKASPPVRVIIIYCSTLFSSTEEANKSRNLFYGQKRKSFWNSYLTHSALHTHTKLSVGPFVKAGWKKKSTLDTFLHLFCKKLFGQVFWSSISSSDLYLGEITFQDTVFENHRKSLIQHCAQSISLTFEWTKVD